MKLFKLPLVMTLSDNKFRRCTVRMLKADYLHADSGAFMIQHVLIFFHAKYFGSVEKSPLLYKYVPHDALVSHRNPAYFKHVCSYCLVSNVVKCSPPELFFYVISDLLK